MRKVRTGSPTTALSATPVMAPLIPLDRQSGTPLYRQIYTGLRTAIVERLLRPGQRLPSTRALAAELGVSRLPVLEAFDLLLAEGYCESRVGSGTFVAEIGGERTKARSGPRLLARAPMQGSAVAAEPWLLGAGASRMSHPAVARFPTRIWGRLVAKHASNPRAAEMVYGSAL